jgi:5,5'-dehydrodivanillate O-demethylase
MITAEDNRLLTQTGPGTPGGELLRRYWQVVATVPELSAETPTKHVRILSEDLVLFRDKSGRVGLLADHCPHRGASLLYGRVEERGIACAYHGWLYDIEGNCLETPAEPADSKLYLTVKHRAYPVQERYGLYWTYMGPPPAPLLPRFDVAEIGTVRNVSVSRQDCNWLQVAENNLDQSHTVILHQATRTRGMAGSNSARGLIDELAGLEYIEAPFGIKRHRIDTSGYDDTDLLVFPLGARIYNHFAYKVPVDDTHSKRYSVMSDLGIDDGRRDPSWSGTDGAITFGQTPVGKTPPDAIHPVATYNMDRLQWQDFMAVETQGAISPRENERLGTADRGIVLLREMLKREIEKVQNGLDPIGVIRDPAHETIDTHIDIYIGMSLRFPPDRARANAR